MYMIVNAEDVGSGLGTVLGTGETGGGAVTMSGLAGSLTGERALQQFH